MFVVAAVATDCVGINVSNIFDDVYVLNGTFGATTPAIEKSPVAGATVCVSSGLSLDAVGVGGAMADYASETACLIF